MVSFFVRAVVCAVSLCLLVQAEQSEDGYDTKQRIQKIRDLGKRNSQAIPTLAQYLSDSNREIRVEAVKAIVKIGGERSLDPLVKALHDHDPEVQIRATDGVVDYYLPGYVARGALSGPLTRGVRQVKGFFSSRNDQAIDPDRVAREDVALGLGGLVTNGASLDARSDAALAAGILRARPAVPGLVQALHSKDNQVIFECLVALQKIQDPSAGPSVSFLARDFDDRIQMTALETIGVLRTLDAAPDVRAALGGARNIRTRRAALECLAMLGISGDRKTFQGYASDKDPELRAAALEGLGRIREPEDFPVLERAYNEPNSDWRVHLAAGFGLVYEGKVDTAEYAPITYLFESLGVKSRSNVASAYLTELVRRDEARASLLKLVPEANKDQKVALCSILASSKSDDVVPALNTMSKDIDPDVAFAASRGLRILQSRKSS